MMQFWNRTFTLKTNSDEQFKHNPIAKGISVWSEDVPNYCFNNDQPYVNVLLLEYVFMY